MMRGVLFFLTDPTNLEAKMLRDHFVFKVIPMLNPDGVINGNYRCSLAGCDLNRRWKTPSSVLHPTIYHTKKLIKAFHKERQLVLYCDLHGHSRKQNVFMYGCNNPKQPEETRLFPYLLGKLNPHFWFEYSRFGNQKSKESTARLSLYKELRTVPNIFTMESSFSGNDKGVFAGKHLSQEGLESLGRDLCRTVLVYTDLHIPEELQEAMGQPSSPSHLEKVKQFKEDEEKQGAGNHILKGLLMDELRENRDLMKKGDGDSSSGSDDAPSEDNMKPDEIIKVLPVVDKKTKTDQAKQKKSKEKEIKE